MHRLLLPLIALFLFAADVRAQNVFEPHVLPSLEIPRISERISIDGDLSESVWQDAVEASGFTENAPRQGARPPVDVRARLAYDEHHLYVAFEIADNPADIRAREVERDAIFEDDYAGLVLDTNGDGRRLYFIAANPLGIQGDSRITPEGGDSSFDLVYRSAGRLTDAGYQVELAIPFRSLRFPATHLQSWRLDLWVTRPRESRNVYNWASLSRSNPCRSCQMGTLSGIEGVAPGRSIEILPSLTGTQNAATNAASDKLRNSRLRMEPSLNLKYGLTSELTLDATLNPDFSQVESDASQIDVNTDFALFFPERRAFFQEGADLYETHFDVVYSRSINDPSAAAKVSGRTGDWAFGYLAARDETSPILVPLEERSVLVTGGRSTSNIVRARRSFRNNSFLAALATDRRLDSGGSGTTAGFDGAIRFKTVYQFEWQALGSYTVESDGRMSSGDLDGTFSRGAHTTALDGESYSGSALYASIEREARNWDFDYDFRQVSPTFRSDNGFIRQNDFRQVNVANAYTFWTDDHAWMEKLVFYTNVLGTWNFDGQLKEEWLGAGVNGRLLRQSSINANISLSNERYRDQQFNGLTRFQLFLNSTPSEYVQLAARLSVGGDIYRSDAPVTGRRLDAGLGGTVRPGTRLSLNPTLDYARLRDRDSGSDFFAGYIFRTRMEYQATRRLTTRLVAEYNDFSGAWTLDPLFNYRVNPFTSFHIGSVHELSDGFNQTRRQLFFKLQVLLRP